MSKRKRAVLIAVTTSLLISMFLFGGCRKVASNEEPKPPADNGPSGSLEPSPASIPPPTSNPNSGELSSNPAPAPKTHAVVNVAVTNLGDGPNSSHGKNTVTQARMGDVLKILQESDGWYEVEMHDGYTGWADPQDIVLYDQSSLDNYFGAKVVFISATTAPALLSPGGDPAVSPDLVQGSVLPTGGISKEWTKVKLPDGREAFILTSNVKEFDGKDLVFAEKRPAEDIIATAIQYVGLPYLWGGTTAYGFDCSGLTQFAYRMNGYNIRRDANMQYEQGEPIEDMSLLEPGDLVFFETYAAGASHVGIYMGDSQYIQAGGSTGLTVQSFNPADDNYSAYLMNAYIGARRIIGAVE